MGYRFLKRSVLILWLGFLFSGVRLADAYPVKLVLSQVDVYLPDIRIYGSLIDEHKKPIHPLLKENTTVKLDGRVVPVQEVTPFEESGEGVAYTLLIDVSKTMAGRPFDDAVDAIKGLIRQMDDHDQLAMITFGDDVVVQMYFSNDRNALLAKLREIKPTHNNTHFYAAVNEAYKLNNTRSPSLPTRRAILVITDGKDEGSGITLDDLLRQNDPLGIPIYSIGYTRIDPIYLDNLKRLSELSGGNFLRSEESQEFADIYQKTFGDIRSQYIIKFETPDSKADGSLHQISVVYTQDNHHFSDHKKIPFVEKQEPTPVPTPTSAPMDTYVPQPARIDRTLMYIAIGVGVLIALVLLGWFIITKRKQKSSPEPEIPGETANVIDTPPPPEETVGMVDTASQEAAQTTPPPVEEEPEEDLPEVQLIVIKGNQRGQKYTIAVDQTGKTIGRQGTDVVINDKGVSKVHCSIAWMNGRFMLKDEGSTNGTFLNGILLRTRDIIEDGSTIEIGQSTLRMKVIKIP